MRQLPLGWARARLDELVGADGLFCDGDWVETKDQDPSGDTRLLQLADIGVGEFRDRSFRWINDSAFNRLSCTELLANDVLIARMPDPLGRACLYPTLPHRSVTVVDVAILRPDTDSIEPRWLMWLLNSPELEELVSRHATGTTRKRISRKNLATIELPVPPVEEQRRIVEALELHFVDIEAALTSIASARDRANALIRSVVEQAYTRCTESGRLALVDDVCDIWGGIQKQPKRTPRQNPYPFLRVANVGRGSLDLADVHQIELFPGEEQRHLLAYGDLLVVEGNGSPSQIGRAALWRAEIPEAAHQNHLIRVRPRDDLWPDYLEMIWNSQPVVDQLLRAASSSSGLYTLSTKKIASVKLPIPSIPIQKSVVHEVQGVVRDAQRAIAAIEIGTARAKYLRRSLLSAAFRGELVDQISVDEPANTFLARIRAEREAVAASKPRKSRSRKVTTA